MTPKIGIFVDVTNLFSATRKVHGNGINYQNYKEWVAECEQGTVTRAIAYGYQDIRGNMHKFIESIKYFGYETRFLQSADGPEYLRWDVQMIVDIMRFMDNFDTIVIGSNDKNLVPLVKAIKDRGKKCIILACMIGRDLKQAASTWYEVEKDDLINEQVA